MLKVRECIARDAYCSPLADRVRHNVGVEYEYRLVEMLRNRRLVFESEDTLRYAQQSYSCACECIGRAVGILTYEHMVDFY